MMENSAEFWVKICDLTDIPPRGSRVLKANGQNIAIFRTVDNEVFALEDRCPHKNGPLSQGIVHGNAVTCPLHNWVISLETGEAVAEKGCVTKFSVKQQDGAVLIALPESCGG